MNAHVVEAELALSRSDPRWESFLRAAAAADDARLVDYSTRHPLPVDYVSATGTTALIEASFAGHLAAVHWLLAQGASPRLQSPLGGDSLHFAAAGGHLEVARALVAAGAHVNSLDRRRHCTALAQACVHGHKELANWLVTNGAEIWLGSMGSTGFETAVAGGHEDIVLMLLRRRTVQWPRDWRERCLWLAAAEGKVALARRFLTLGADRTWRAPNGLTASEQCVASNVHVSLELFED